MSTVPPSIGTVALVGSGEYLPPILPLDKQLLTYVQGTPHVVVIPTASAPDGAGVPERWARMGVEHFTTLGAAVEPVMLLTREDANTPAIVEQIANANFIYFSGGKPRYLLETLQHTAAWEAVTRVYQNGGVLAGCSAGAMVMGGYFFDFPQVWRTQPALGLVPDIIVIPHFDEIPSSLISPLAKKQDQALTVGIDGSTALVGSDNTWSVLGIGTVTLFTDHGRVKFSAGEDVPLSDFIPVK